MTLPMVARKPLARASSNATAGASAWTVTKAEAPVVPMRTRSRRNRRATRGPVGVRDGPFHPNGTLHESLGEPAVVRTGERMLPRMRAGVHETRPAPRAGPQDAAFARAGTRIRSAIGRHAGNPPLFARDPFGPRDVPRCPSSRRVRNGPTNDRRDRIVRGHRETRLFGLARFELSLRAAWRATPERAATRLPRSRRYATFAKG
jgi:hypothetical protein